MYEPWMIFAGLAGAAVSAWVAWRACTEAVVVEANETVFVVKNGVRSAPLTTGLHRLAKGNLEVFRFDLRTQELKVPGQEVLTRDRVGIKATVLARYQIKDALLMVDASNYWYGALYTEVQLVLREAVALFELDELLDGRAALNERVQAPLVERFAALGVELQGAQVMDVMLAGDLKRAMAQVAQARAEGKAKLEQARAETASLRSMANAARMLQDNARLLDLRTLQVAEKAAESMGNTLVLGVDPKGPEKL